MIRSSPPGSLHIHRRCGKLYFGVRQRGSNGKFHERHLPENDLLLQAYIRKYCAGKVLYPDFEIISPVSGKTYYLEVCGLMDNEEYRDRLFHRIDLLAENDIVLGNNLLLVFESANHPVNRSSFEKMLKETVLAI